MDYDFDKLRYDLKEECLGAMFGGGFGLAIVDLTDIESASDEELLKYAKRFGFDLRRYQIR